MNLLPAARRRGLVALGGVALAAALGVGMAGSPAYAEGTVLGAGTPTAIAGSYIVVLKDASMSAQGVGASASSLTNKYGGTVAATYSAAMRGFSAQMSERAARRLAADPAVAFVEADQIYTIDATQPNPPSWGLDRIDQRNLPLSASYTYPDQAGAGVHIYVIDTGVLHTHTTFGGRASSGRDAVSEDNDATDCHGHGTHVAGTTAGSQYGVAKAAFVHGVRVLGCTGSGTTTDIVQGIDWVTQNGVRPAVANMSLGGAGANAAMETAVNNSINAGVTYALAAGNSNSDACNFSPARTPAAITVGATQSNDARSSFSNFGTCVDIFAPGTSITSSWFTSTTATNTISGTSMASPHVAGAAALILGANPSLTPQQVRDQMVNAATTGVITSPGTGSPNRLLFVGGAQPPPPGTTVFFDNFETATGWTTNPNGTDTATTGQWVRGDPGATTSGGVTLQLGTTVSGTNDLVTGAPAGASAGEFDVDGGVTTVQSPAITLPATGTLSLSFSWYLAHLNNSSTADFFRVFVVTGTSTQVFQQLGAATNRAGAWATANVNLSSFAGQTIRLRIETADASTASLVEAGVDDVRITQN